MTPDQVFAEKWPRVEHIVHVRARIWGVPASDLDDVLQLAALNLLTQCRQGIRNVNCMLIAIGAWERFARQQRGGNGRGQQRPASLDAPNQKGHARAGELPADAQAIRLGHGLTYTLADARMDEAAAFRLLDAGDAGAADRARQLGIYRQRIDASPRKYGGVLFPTGQWRYPAAVVE